MKRNRKMSHKNIIKRIIDISLLALYLVLMAFQYTGKELHEWMGTTLFLVVIVHQLLNIKWYKNLVKGKYTLLRILQVVLNLLLIADTFVMMITGIMMSGYVFAWLPIHGRAYEARAFHLAGAHWGYILMSMHFGMHFAMMTPMWKKLEEQKGGVQLLWGLKLIKPFGVLYGFYAFFRQGIYSYLFFQTEFYQWGAAPNVFVFTLQNLAMMIAFGVFADLLKKLSFLLTKRLSH